MNPLKQEEENQLDLPKNPTNLLDQSKQGHENTKT